MKKLDKKIFLKSQLLTKLGLNMDSSLEIVGLALMNIKFGIASLTVQIKMKM